MSHNLAKVLVLTKNEYDLIDDFLRFYSFIFGASNIVVIDNGSDDPRVLQTYETYTKLGVVIERDADRGMMDMAQIMTDAMRRHASEATFLIPLDTDEFMFLPGRPDIRDIVDARAAILEHLRGLESAPGVSILRYAKFLGSVADPGSADYVDHKHTRPARSIRTYHDQGWDKLIARSSDFVSISQGNHHATTRCSDGQPSKQLKSELLGLLHFHETGAARKRERCVMSMLGYGHMTAEELLLGPDEQLALCEVVIRRRCFGGHRVEQYREFLRREILCREFSRANGRLPSQEEAVACLTRDSIETIDIGRVDGAECIGCADDIVYYETPRSDMHVVDQLAKFFESLDSLKSLDSMEAKVERKAKRIL